MRKKIASILLILFLLVGCNTEKTKNDKLSVVSSYTIITDMVMQIGQDIIDVYNLVPTGTDPHEYEPLPADMKAVSDADLVFYNGLNLEGGQGGWLFKLLSSVNKNEDLVINLSEGVTPMYLYDEETVGNMNPHAFLNPNVGMIMVNNILDTLVSTDPDNAEFYERNASFYLETLEAIDYDYRSQISDLLEENKILVTSERAFQYMTSEYGLKEAYIWALDTDEIGTANQIKSLTQFIKDNNVKVLFLESNVDPRPMETVSQESGVPIYVAPIFSDEIGSKESEVDTYVKMLRHNLDVITGGLGQ